MRLAHPHVEPARIARHLRQPMLPEHIVDEAGAIHATTRRVGGAKGVSEIFPCEVEAGLDERSHAGRLRVKLEDITGRDGGVGCSRGFRGRRNFRLRLRLASFLRRHGRLRLLLRRRNVFSDRFLPGFRLRRNRRHDRQSKQTGEQSEQHAPDSFDGRVWHGMHGVPSNGDIHRHGADELAFHLIGSERVRCFCISWFHDHGIGLARGLAVSGGVLFYAAARLYAVGEKRYAG